LAPAARPALTVKLAEPVKPALIHEAKPRIEPAFAEPEELDELEDEIAFRRSPEFAPPIQAEPIPANIIEFPRQLIAPRKARPRLAEGPLMDEGPREPQLRIFEVEPEQLTVTLQAEPEGVPVAGPPEWQRLVLDNVFPAAQPEAPPDAQAQLTFAPQTAPNSRRFMAAAVDLICVLASFVGFCTLAAYICGASLLQAKPALLAGSAAAALAVFGLVYLSLFFTFSDATPGMRYARIALCTFSDENPSRKSMRRRTWAMLLAACPLGLGFAWIFMDNDRLGWHDRISRMYQRAY